MDDRKPPQDNQFHEYDPPNVVPLSRKPAPVTTFLDSLRSTGVPEPVIEQARSVLATLGLTDASLNDMRQTFDQQAKKGVDWSKKNPQKAAGGFAAIVVGFGLLLLLLERRR